MYNKIFLETINGLTSKPKLLLHSCCAPCSSYVIKYLMDYFDITVLFYNPNIEPIDEYIKRKKEQIKLCEIYNIKMLDCDYENDVFKSNIKGLENLAEGGLRCVKCFEIRLRKTCSLAAGYDFFGTTLTVSPHKNSKMINELGIKLSDDCGTKFLVSDFKKNDGYKKSIMFSKEYDLYRQEYCGCLFSKRGDL